MNLLIVRDWATWNLFTANGTTTSKPRTVRLGIGELTSRIGKQSRIQRRQSRAANPVPREKSQSTPATNRSDSANSTNRSDSANSAIPTHPPQTNSPRHRPPRRLATPSPAEASRPPSPAEASRLHARSILLSAPDERLIAKLDLLELDGMKATPVDYKRGKVPDVAEGAYEPERVQLCAQGLVLRENGFQCDHGVLYFIGSKKRVTIPFTDELIARTRQLRDEFLQVSAGTDVPPPLVDSPKCTRCSLVGICLPDEVVFLKAAGELPSHGCLPADTIDDPIVENSTSPNQVNTAW